MRYNFALVVNFVCCCCYFFHCWLTLLVCYLREIFVEHLSNLIKMTNNVADSGESLNDNATTENGQPETANDHKERGNECIKKGKYIEAILHYNFAIKLNPNEATFYSNRSLAFLKLNQLYYANEDAEKAIHLKPDWAKGYFRKAEVQAAAGQYDSSFLLYSRSLQLQPNDISILNAAKRIAQLSSTDMEFERRVPWFGIGIGALFGVLIVILDFFTKTPTLSHPSLMVLMIVVISIIGYGISRGYLYYRKQQRIGLLEPPLNLLDEFKKPIDPTTNDDCTDGEPYTNRTRYTKAQARQRFKRGKT